MRTISVISGKGGVGKTTITTNLGAVLSNHFNKKVAVIDCNITTPHLGMMLGIDHSPVTLNHVLKGEANINEALYNHSSGMWIIPSSMPLKELSGVDISLLSDSLKKMYNKYVGKIDIVLLDCSPGLGREAMSGIRASDEMLFVTMPNMPALMDIIRCNNIVREMGIHHTGIALNMTGQSKHELKLKEVERITGIPVLSSIPSDKNMMNSLSKRMLITTTHPKSKSSKALISLASSLLKHSNSRPTLNVNWGVRQ